jgi:hypothetical protein
MCFECFLGSSSTEYLCTNLLALSLPDSNPLFLKNGEKDTIMPPKVIVVSFPIHSLSYKPNSFIKPYSSFIERETAQPPMKNRSCQHLLEERVDEHTQRASLQPGKPNPQPM